MDRDIPEKVFAKYFTYEARLASFQKAQPVIKSRTSSARGPKSMTWPHKSIESADLARAGFFYYPLQIHPDNAVCFLCRRAMDGWEPDDNPSLEHISHSRNCGWAVASAIELDIEDYATADPSSAAMMEARKSTFADKWPYEDFPAWKCKTKQLAEAGWKYTPCADSDDMTTCTYCQLALDGWEQDDDPMYEHLKRSADCLFFQLLKHYGEKPKKTAKGKARASKHTSRASRASTATMDPSALDATAQVEDSLVTTTSTGGRKAGRKKATATKGRKTRVKKEDPIELTDDEIIHDEPPPPPPKTEAPPARKKRATRGKAKVDESSLLSSQADVSAAPSARGRGKKRTSDALEDSATAETEAPEPKRKRATRGKSKAVVEESTVDDAPAKKTTKKGRAASTARKITRKTATRKASAASIASLVSSSPPPQTSTDIPDDATIDRQLLADIDCPFSDDEDLHGDSGLRRQNIPANPSKQNNTSSTVGHHEESKHFEMFDPHPRDPDEDELSAELDTMDAGGKHPQPQSQFIAGATAKTGRGFLPQPGPEEKVEAHEESIVSTGTVIRNELSLSSMEETEGSQEHSATNGMALRTEGARLSTASNVSITSQSSKRGRERPQGGRPPKKATSSASRISEQYRTEIPSVAAPTQFSSPFVVTQDPQPSTAMDIDQGVADRHSFISAKDSIGPGHLLPGAFPDAPQSRPHGPKSTARKPEPPPKDAPLPSLPNLETSPAPSTHGSPQSNRAASPVKKLPVPSPFRQAVMSPFRAVQAAFSSPSRAGFLSPSKEKLASDSKESLIPTVPKESYHQRHSPAKAALSRVAATPSKEKLVAASSARQGQSVTPMGAENAPLSAVHDPFISTSVAPQPLLASVMREPILTSPSRHDPISPSGGDVIMSDGEPGTPTPVRHGYVRHMLPLHRHQSQMGTSLEHLAHPSTPGHVPSSSQSARQPFVSPSQSPQSSDAENHPPSSRPASIISKRHILAPAPPKTPSRMSPARRNIMGAVQTTVPWSPIDLEKVFGSEKEVVDRVGHFFDAKDDKLSSPELNMTVEEWVAYRGRRAEEFVKEECETMVSDFEKKGMQALRAVEGLVAVDE